MSEMEKKVLDAIAARRLAPRPHAVFLARRSVFWLLAGLSTLFGATGVAVLLFAVSDYYATGWRSFDNMPFDDLLLSIPAVWMAATALCLASAYYGLRHTRRGYRIPASHLVGLCLAASLGLGTVFHVFEVGRTVNDVLSSQFAAYRAMTHVPFDEWSRPDEGYLGGTVESVDGSASLRLRDFHGRDWLVDIRGADVRLDQPIIEEGDIAIRGARTGDAAFHADTIDEFD